MRHCRLRLLSALLVCLLLVLSANAAIADQKVQVLVLTDRIATRMEPQLFHAFRSAAATAPTKERLDFIFTVFNPHAQKGEANVGLDEAMPRIRENLKLSAGLTADLRRRLEPGQSLFAAVDAFARAHPESSLGRLRQTVDGIMGGFDFLVVEPTFETVVHPMFYNPGVSQAEVGYATMEDIEDTLYGLFFIQAAVEAGKPVYGACHGAQLGWLLAGGGLARVLEYVEEEAPGAYYSRRNPHTGRVEVWWMDRMLNSHDPIVYEDSGPMIYPVPEPFARGRKGLFLVKDFNHTLAMTKPVPAGAEVLSYHPLSRNVRADGEYEVTGAVPGYPMLTDAARRTFKSMLADMVIVDAFRYKTMFGFQYHPQETFDDMDARAIFEYLAVAAEKRAGVAE